MQFKLAVTEGGKGAAEMLCSYVSFSFFTNISDYMKFNTIFLNLISQVSLGESQI